MIELDSGDKELLRRAMAKLHAANEIIKLISDHFRDKYELSPTMQITPDGRIVDATSQREIQKSDFAEHQNGNASRETSQASSSNSTEEIP